MFKRTLAAALATAVLIGVAAAAAAPAVEGAWRDVLDTPATPSALAPRSLLLGLARAGTSIVAVGQRGHAIVSDDAGKSWTQAKMPVSSDLVAVSFPSAKAGWAVGHDGVVLHSADGGRSWAVQLDGRKLGELLVAHYQAAGDEKWLAEAKRFAAQGAENPFLDVWFESETTGWVVGAFGLVLRTEDGGAHWSPMMHAAENPKSLHLYAVRGVAGEVYFVGEQGTALKLDRASGKLRALEVPYKGTLFGVTGSEAVVIAHGLRGTVLRSTDRGHSWQPVPTGVAVGLTASTVDEQGVLVVVSQAGHVIASRDNGASFIPVKIERPIPAAAVVAAGKGALVLAGPRGVQAVAMP